MDSCGGRRFGGSLLFLRAMGLVNASNASNSSSVVQSEDTGVTGGQSSSAMASSWTDNKKEVAFASILLFVGLAALYPALKLANSTESTDPTESSKSDIGIAPMLPWIYAIMSNPKDYTQVSLLYSTEIAEEVLLKDKLDELAAAHPNFKVFYTVDIASKDWKGGKGLISRDMILKGLPHPSEDTLILIAGSPKMMDCLCGDKAKERWPGQVTGLLRELGYKQDQVHKFW